MKLIILSMKFMFKTRNYSFLKHKITHFYKYEIFHYNGKLFIKMLNFFINRNLLFNNEIIY